MHYSHTSPKRNSIFSLPSIFNWLKIIINKFFINTASKIVIKTTYDIKVNQILLFNIVEFTHLSFHELPCCLITKLLKWDFKKPFSGAVLQYAKICGLSGFMLQVIISYHTEAFSQLVLLKYLLKEPKLG